MSFNFTIVGQSASLVARYSGPGEKNMYLATITYTSPTTYTVSLVKNINGVSTVLGQVTTSIFAAPCGSSWSARP